MPSLRQLSIASKLTRKRAWPLRAISSRDQSGTSPRRGIAYLHFSLLTSICCCSTSFRSTWAVTDPGPSVLVIVQCMLRPWFWSPMPITAFWLPTNIRYLHPPNVIHSQTSSSNILVLVPPTIVAQLSTSRLYYYIEDQHLRYQYYTVFARRTSSSHLHLIPHPNPLVLVDSVSSL
jgi:hypothetical protein